MGWAGLITALRAAELGASVIAIDKMPSGDWIGGSMPLSGQFVHVCGTSPLVLSEAELREAVAVASEGRPQKPYAELVDALVTNVKRGCEWLVDKGVEFDTTLPGILSCQMQPGKPYGYAWGFLKPGAKGDYRNYGGFKAAKLLESQLKEQALYEILYETKAEKLLTNDKREVVGVLAKDKDGLFEIKAKATILCTGGFNKNREMAEKYLGRHGEDIPVQCCPGATGDGHVMALELGAAMKNMTYTYWWPCPAIVEEDEWHDLLGYTEINAIGTQGIIVTESGERYCDESGGRFIYGNRLFRLGLVKALMIIDEAIYGMEGVGSIVDELISLGGTVHKADTIEELASKAGVSPYLAATVSDFNQAIDDGTVERLRFPKTSNINKIAAPPFYGVPYIAGTLFHYGGLQVNPNSEVLDTDKAPIPGLYAAGELMCGSLAGGAENKAGSYVGGALAGFCLTFGLLAAENAVERAKA